MKVQFALNYMAARSALFLAIGLTACGGGGSGGSELPALLPTTAPLPSMPIPSSSLGISGTAVDLATGAALAGFAVTVGPLPATVTCSGSQTALLNTCGVPAAPTTLTSVNADGSFGVKVAKSGSYMLQIAKDGTYATLHRQVEVSVGMARVGTVRISALSADEQAWLVDANLQRATNSFPVSYGNLVVDEYAQEQARLWAADIVTGKTMYSDEGYGPYQNAYLALPGAMYGNSGVLDLVGSGSAFAQADRNWMAEKSMCPPLGNWETCTFAEDTGHYMILSDTNAVWIGLGESHSSFADGPYGQQFAYNLMLIENPDAGAPVEKIHRALSLQTHALSSNLKNSSEPPR